MELLKYHRIEVKIKIKYEITLLKLVDRKMFV